MKILKHLLCFSFLLGTYSMLTAAHHKTEIPTEITLQEKLQLKKEIIKIYFSKKHLKKRQKSDDEKISNGVLITILAGCLGVSLLLFAIFSNLAFIIFISIGASFLSSIFGFSTIQLIKESGTIERHIVSLIMVILGLIPSLTIVNLSLIVLILFLIFII